MQNYRLHKILQLSLIALLLLAFSGSLRADNVLDKLHKNYPARIKKDSDDSQDTYEVESNNSEESNRFEDNNKLRLSNSQAESTAVAAEANEYPAETVFQRKLSPNEITVSLQPLAPSSTVEFETPWGLLPFSNKAAYHYRTERGPGFSIRIPEDWKNTEPKKHTILGGMHYRYLAPAGYPHAPYVVVAVFPMKDDVDLAEFLGKKQIDLFSSFKFKEARNLSLGRRSGIGVYYEGILKMSDVSCHLFLTRYRGKGYAIYGLYFDRAGGEAIGEIMHSVRISF